MNVETAGAALAAHLDVDKVGFTGLTEGGSSSLARCRWSLEGKCPTSCAKTPMWKPISQGWQAHFFNHGQCCCAGSRLFVEKGNKANVLIEVVFHGRSNREQIAPLSNDRRFAVQTNPCCSGKMRRIGRLKSDIGREDQMLPEAIFSRTIRVVTDPGSTRPSVPNPPP